MPIGTKDEAFWGFWNILRSLIEEIFIKNRIGHEISIFGALLAYKTLKKIALDTKTRTDGDVK